MPPDAYAAQRLCILVMFLLAGIGLAIGFGIGLSSYGTRWSPNAVLTARDYAERRPPRRVLPSLPKGVFFSTLFLWLPLVKGWCPGFLKGHWLFVAGLLGCCVSSAAWLPVAFFFQEGVASERSARIEQFITSADEQVPAPVVVEASPSWLRNWKLLNIAVFALLMSNLIYALLMVPTLKN